MDRPDVLVIGGSGFLGGALLARAQGRWDVVGTYHAHAPSSRQTDEAGDGRGAGAPRLAVDVRDAEAVARVVRELRPRAVVNASVATTAEARTPVIEQGAENVARAAFECGAELLQISSDMVFDGESGPFDETSPVSPLTPYGRAKAESERRARAAHAHARVVRCPLLYRRSPPDPSTGSWLEGVRAGQGYALFTDELRCPAPVEDVAASLLAIALALVAGEALPEILHLPGPEAISRYDFGRLVLAAHGLSPDLATPGRRGSSGVRPRDLTLVARATPRAFTESIRSPGRALAVDAPPAEPRGSVRSHAADRAANRS